MSRKTHRGIDGRDAKTASFPRVRVPDSDHKANFPDPRPPPEPRNPAAGALPSCTDGAKVFADRGLAYEKKGELTQALRDYKKAHALGFRHSLLLKKLRESGEFL